MWFPEVKRCMPQANNSFADSAVIPKPPDAFSPLAITTSTLYRSTRRCSSRETACLPGLPTISPIKRMLTGILDCPGFADDVDLYLTGISHLGLDLLGDILCKDNGSFVGNFFARNHDPYFASGLDSKRIGNAGE